MERSLKMRPAVGTALLALLASLVLTAGCGKPPMLNVTVKALAPDGDPLAGVDVQAGGVARGQTGADGLLTFEIQGEVGSEIPITATLDRQGLKFKPWSYGLVVRKPEKDKPETLKYDVEASLEPEALSADIVLQADGEPAAKASVKLDGDTVELDEGGRATVDLGTDMSRTVTLTARLKGYKSLKEELVLSAGETSQAELIKHGTFYGTVTVAYEVMGRRVLVEGAEVTLRDKTIGTTNAQGRLKYRAPPRKSKMQVRKPGFVPEVVEIDVPARRRRKLVAALAPRFPPHFNLALMPPTSTDPGDKKLERALPEVEDKLSDYLFSYGCFEPVGNAAFVKAMESGKLTEETLVEKGWAGHRRIKSEADAVVLVEASQESRGRLLLSVRLIGRRGEHIGGFVETEKFSRINRLAEEVSRKVLEVFPFEGHVLELDRGGKVVTSLGKGGNREVRKGAKVKLYKWTALPNVSLTALGTSKVRKVRDAESLIEKAGGGELAVGDKVVLVPRAVEATFNASVSLTVVAGREGGPDIPLPHVSVYRDGLWVGTTSPEGKLKVRLASGREHGFLFTKGRVRPHLEPLKVEGKREARTVRLPFSLALARIDSQPSRAQTSIDGRTVGTTPLQTDVLMGFHRVTIEAGEEWRTFDEVLEFASEEVDYTGSRRIRLQKDLLKVAEKQLSKGDVNAAIRTLAKVGKDHPDYSAAHNRLGGLYLDEKKKPALAVQEFERVLAVPENRELVNKRFAVTFLNLGRAYYHLGTPDGYDKAIARLTTARTNKRFFPQERHHRATHDTLYFMALSSHKLYYARGGDRLLSQTSRRWKDYFDFFPKALQDDESVKKARAGAEDFYEEIRRKLGEEE